MHYPSTRIPGITGVSRGRSSVNESNVCATNKSEAGFYPLANPTSRDQLDAYLCQPMNGLHTNYLCTV